MWMSHPALSGSTNRVPPGESSAANSWCRPSTAATVTLDDAPTRTLVNSTRASSAVAQSSSSSRRIVWIGRPFGPLSAEQVRKFNPHARPCELWPSLAKTPASVTVWNHPPAFVSQLAASPDGERVALSIGLEPRNGSQPSFLLYILEGDGSVRLADATRDFRSIDSPVFPGRRPAGTRPGTGCTGSEPANPSIRSGGSTASSWS